MRATELLILNFEEVRRRSVKAWQGIPAAGLQWKPEAAAMTCIEMVRHVLEGEWLYMQILRSGGSLASDESPFNPRPYTDVAAEIAFAEPYRKEFLNLVDAYTAEELTSKKVDRSDKGYVRTVGDFLLRVAYHEAVHAGQLLSYLRLMNVPRPNIWD
ncbi:MAG TPA: DinB family protein [Blastocatellia bacterium]|nr:DinB family protein [Blastocatellia bacterium]